MVVQITMEIGIGAITKIGEILMKAIIITIIINNGGSNFNPNFNANNFNNGGYNNNPNRYFPQQPINQNQGWNQLPFGNPNHGNPTYGGQIPRWFNNMRPRSMNSNVICFNCQQPGHISTNCPNPRAHVPYIPICGNCKQNGRTAEECNGPRQAGPRDNDGYVKRDNTPKLVLISKENGNNANRNVNHVEVLMESIGERDSHDKLVQQVLTRGQRSKQIPSGSLPLVHADKDSISVISSEEVPLETKFFNLSNKDVTPNVVVAPSISANKSMGVPLVNNPIPVTQPIINLGEPTRKFNLVVTQEYHPYTPTIPIVLKNRSSKSSKENENHKIKRISEARQLPQVGNKTPIDIGLTTYNQIDNVPNVKTLGNFPNQPNLEVRP
jgi:hypothetical protein